MLFPRKILTNKKYSYCSIICRSERFYNVKKQLKSVQILREKFPDLFIFDFMAFRKANRNYLDSFVEVEDSKLYKLQDYEFIFSILVL